MSNRGGVSPDTKSPNKFITQVYFCVLMTIFTTLQDFLELEVFQFIEVDVNSEHIMWCLLCVDNSDLSCSTCRTSKLFWRRWQSGPCGSQCPQGATGRWEGERWNAVQLSSHLQNKSGKYHTPMCTFTVLLIVRLALNYYRCMAQQTCVISNALLKNWLTSQNILLKDISCF